MSSMHVSNESRLDLNLSDRCDVAYTDAVVPESCCRLVSGSSLGNMKALSRLISRPASNSDGHGITRPANPTWCSG